MKHDLNYHSGVAAENSVAQKYAACGYRILAQRYRVKEGEIDLIASQGQNITFVEVKKSKNFDRAAEMIKPKQMLRIQEAALRYLQEHNKPIETEMRFDAALVDATGQIKIIPNAFL